MYARRAEVSREGECCAIDLILLYLRDLERDTLHRENYAYMNVLVFSLICAEQEKNLFCSINPVKLRASKPCVLVFVFFLPRGLFV